MAGTQVLSKILDLRNKEKKEAQLAYFQSVNEFEDKATKLYNLLKEKETIENSLEFPTGSIVKLDYIKEQHLYLEKLTQEIMIIQGQVQQARHHMESRQALLSDAHIETKKFERLIEIRKDELETKAKKAEEILMDSVSIQQYLKFSK
ncbi:flagellar export protein FliJ [Ornithinibacillus halotolerans]|uniref:Flagellar FliJ protein n=1 Tax=Ornithinibacillus halotolerans TaxID=1274357 RepID=A0A916W3D1_9BACI|nr:flagellar export protein FliJ [Ornithinibacillus halotolerans]GGA63094.1 hypothetical protein GCM10008025_03770 [Ornithinibacillus halotolerans]